MSFRENSVFHNLNPIDSYYKNRKRELKIFELLLRKTMVYNIWEALFMENFYPLLIFLRLIWSYFD